MEKNMTAVRPTLTMQMIFRYMMENGYYPEFDNTFILFDVGENTAFVDYEEGILSVKMFFAIEKDSIDTFLKASNDAMMSAYMVRPIITEEKSGIIFSCETFCDNIKDLRSFFPRLVIKLAEGLEIHKLAMQDLFLRQCLVKKHTSEYC